MFIIIIVLLFILGCTLLGIGELAFDWDWAWEYRLDRIFIISGVISIIASIILTFFGFFHGFIKYKPSEDKDLARIVAVTQEQDLFKTYYKIEVEYLTNTPTQNGVLQKKEIEKDTFYCYYENKELVEQLKNNLYKEIWIISGYKGGYDGCCDFGNHLLKRIELKEE